MSVSQRTESPGRTSRSNSAEFESFQETTGGQHHGAPPELHIDISQAERTTSPPDLASGPSGQGNAHVQQETKADGRETFGALNQHPASIPSTPALPGTSDGPAFTSKEGRGPPASEEGLPPTYKVGVSVDRNRKCRRTMEDAHSFIYDFGGIRGQGYFAVFDGHAGKHAAEWCGAHFHEHLLHHLHPASNDKDAISSIPEVLNKTFHTVDLKLSELASQENTHSGCTAVTVFLRLEDEKGNPVGQGGGIGQGVEVVGDSAPSVETDSAVTEAVNAINLRSKDLIGESEGKTDNVPEAVEQKRGFREKMKDVVRGMSSSSPTASPGSPAAPAPTHPAQGTTHEVIHIPSPKVKVNGPAEVKSAARRTLYTANVGDARAVLSRAGRAVRLTYDHKGSDEKEAKRIMDAGGFVMNNRVNGVLAVTRSLGDSSMKEFVVGSPYTTETTLSPEDDYLIVACDGLWDVCKDQEAVDIIKDCKGPQEASKALLDHALEHFSTDNLSVLVVALH